MFLHLYSLETSADVNITLVQTSTTSYNVMLTTIKHFICWCLFALCKKSVLTMFSCVHNRVSLPLIQTWHSHTVYQFSSLSTECYICWQLPSGYLRADSSGQILFIVADCFCPSGRLNCWADGFTSSNVTAQYESYYLYGPRDHL